MHAQTSDAENMSADDMIRIRGAYKQYSPESSFLKICTPKDKPHLALAGLNMTVKRGAIYTLIGPSGCGKTTLLSCIVGRRTLNAGKISLGVKHLSEIGYMPQDVSLTLGLTINENIAIYSRLFNLSEECIKKTRETVYTFLELPLEDCLVKDLSGGQQRRLSLYIALLHNPDLLILDEPTVGLDPALSQKIWDYFLDLANNNNKTLLLTTHYIEEARKAHKIGLMRKGLILKEGTPEGLMIEYESQSIDELFVKLSTKHKTEKRFSQANIQHTAVVKSPLMRNTGFQWSHCACQIKKNYYWLKGNKALCAFLFLLPLLECLLYYYAVGKSPHDLKIGIINYELVPGRESCKNWSTTSCSPDNISQPLSCLYLDILEKRNLNIAAYDSMLDAEEAVLRNDIWGFLHVKQNYSRALLKRLEMSLHARDEDLDISEIEVWMDTTNQIIANILRNDMYKAYQQYLEKLYLSCSWPVAAANIPIRMKEPVYGSENITFTEFTLPAVLELTAYFHPIIAILGGIIDERSHGLWERNMVSGMTIEEILVGHFIFSAVILISQVLSTTTVIFGILDNMLIGSYLLYSSLLFVIGICGLVFGVLIGVSCESEFAATFLGLGSFFPMTLLSGMLWPTEGMNALLRSVAQYFPTTMSTESFRAISLRGWNLSHPTVYNGFIATVGFTILYFIAVCIVIKLKNLK